MLMMTERNLKQQLQYSYYEDMEDGRTIETIDYDALIGILTELLERVEQLEKDNEILKSYAWEQ
jgi:heme oxygenase